MNLDERVLFYLEHQARIEEWKNLHGDVCKAADTFFRSLSKPLKERVSEWRDGSPEMIAALNTDGNPRFMIRDMDWPISNEREPLVRLALEWTVGGSFTESFTGIQVNMEEREGRRLYDILLQLRKQRESRPGRSPPKKVCLCSHVLSGQLMA